MSTNSEVTEIKRLRELLAKAYLPWSRDKRSTTDTQYADQYEDGEGHIICDWTTQGAAELAMKAVNSLPELIRVVEAVAAQDLVVSDSSMAQFCRMCGAATEDEPVHGFSDGMDNTKDLSVAELDLWDARRAAWEKKARAEMKHADDCAWVIAVRLTGGRNA